MNEAIEILLVEDTPSDVELTLRAFKKNNFANKIFVVGDGQEALDYIYKEGQFKDRETTELPRLILLDLKLPKISGIEVLKVLKTDPVTKKIPIVVLTSSKEDRDIHECYNLGVNSYIAKPVDFNQFVTTVRELGLYWLLLNESSSNRGI